MGCIKLRDLNIERERKVSRLMVKVKERGLGRRMRADRADFTTQTSTDLQS